MEISLMMHKKQKKVKQWALATWLRYFRRSFIVVSSSLACDDLNNHRLSLTSPLIGVHLAVTKTKITHWIATSRRSHEICGHPTFENICVLLPKDWENAWIDCTLRLFTRTTSSSMSPNQRQGKLILGIPIPFLHQHLIY